jgi:hypothetical protein
MEEYTVALNSDQYRRLREYALGQNVEDTVREVWISALYGKRTGRWQRPAVDN